MAGEPEQHTTITVPQIARRLDVCEETVYAMLKAHEIPNLRHIKADPDVIEEFYRIADAQGWVLGETLERAVKALENKIGAREKPERVPAQTQHAE